MKRKKFKINKIKVKTISKYLVIVIVVLASILVFPSTLSLYSSNGQATAKVDVAYSLLNLEGLSDTIRLDNIEPNGQYKSYTFSVRNFEGEGENKHRIDVNMKYSIVLKTTTNLPIDYELYVKNSDGSLTSISNEIDVLVDDYGTIWNYYESGEYKVSFNSDYTNNYVLKYKLDSKYNHFKFQDISELIMIKIDAEQIQNI